MKPPDSRARALQPEKSLQREAGTPPLQSKPQLAREKSEQQRRPSTAKKKNFFKESQNYESNQRVP